LLIGSHLEGRIMADTRKVPDAGRDLRWRGTALGIALSLLLTPGARAGEPSGEKGGTSDKTFKATAYDAKGKTAAGDPVKPGVVAADPKVLPPGSRVRVKDAGAYSGEYVVKDKGPAVKGHEVDIYVPGKKRAKQFGKKPVKVDVVKKGDGSRAGAREEPVPPPAARAPAVR
jgi:3D (Asp-Asp-Asp) domain-containing protein